MNKVPAKSIEARISAGAGQETAGHAWIVMMPRPDGSLTYLIFVAPENQFEKLRPTFEAILRSFHLG